MHSVNVREVRSHLADLLAQVGSGRTIAITQRGREVARLVPTDAAESALPSRAAQRRAMGRATRSTVTRMRDEDRA
jgi:prevent-host-death family protein